VKVLLGLAIDGGAQFLLVVLITRGLSTGSAGALLEAFALFTILSTVGLLGADVGLVRMLPRLRAQGRLGEVRPTLLVALVPVFFVGVALGLCLFFFATPIANLLFSAAHRRDAVTYMHIFAPFLPLASLMSTALAATRGLGTMLPYVVVQNIGLAVLRPALVLLVLTLGLGSQAIALAWAVPLALCTVAAFASTRFMLARAAAQDALTAQTAQAAPSARAIARSFWRFAAPRSVASIFGVAVLSLDVLLVGAMRSTREAGIYAAASRLAMVGSHALQALSKVLAPQVSALLARGDRLGLERLYQFSTWWLMALSWPAYATLAVFAPVFMGLFGQDYRTGAEALLILALAEMVDLGTGNMTTLLLMSGRSDLNLANSVVSVLLNITLNLALIPRIGINGAALAWATSILVTNLLTLIEVRVLLGVRPFGSGYYVVVTATICYGALELIFRTTIGATLEAVLIAVVSATLAYGILLAGARKLLRFDELREALRQRPSTVAPH